MRLITDEDAWRPRYFDPAEPGSIDMWLGPTRRVSSQTQLREQDLDAERTRHGVTPRHPETVGGSVS